MTLNELLDWFRQTEEIPAEILQHIRLSYLPVLAAMAVALPAGLAIGHARKFELAVVNLANFGRAVPSFAILALALPISIELGLGLGFWPTFAALFFLSIPPILTNTYIGVKGVDPDAVEAARGMGFSGMQLLLKVELPLAMPLIVTGIRTAAVQSVATATLAALVAGGGLGAFIFFGFRAGADDYLIGGAILVGLLAIATEIVGALLERAVRPKRGAPAAPSRVEPLEQVMQPGPNPELAA